MVALVSLVLSPPPSNAFLASTGYKAPIAKKTGTTICGIIYKDGVVLGADTRATEGSIVADKNCAKIHYISKFIYCCGAGTAADTENVTGQDEKEARRGGGGARGAPVNHMRDVLLTHLATLLCLYLLAAPHTFVYLCHRACSRRDQQPAGASPPVYGP